MAQKNIRSDSTNDTANNLNKKRSHLPKRSKGKKPSKINHFIDTLINDKAALHKVLIVFFNGAFSCIIALVTSDVFISCLYSAAITVFGMIAEALPTINMHNSIKKMLELSNGFKHIFLIILAAIPTAVGMRCRELITFPDIIVDNFFPDILGALIVSSVFSYLSRFDIDEIISSLESFSDDFFRVFLVFSFNIAFFNAVNYRKDDPRIIMHKVNDLYIGFIFFVGMSAVCLAAVRIMDKRMFSYKLKKPYPIYTLVVSGLFLLSYGVPFLFLKDKEADWFLLTMDTLAFNLTAWFFFVFIYRRSYKTHKERPWLWWFTFSLLTVGSTVLLCINRLEEQLLAQMLSGFAIFFVALILLLYINHKQTKSNREEEKMPKALITGITGQDGLYLSEFLLEKGYEVHGIICRDSVDHKERIKHLKDDPHFHIYYEDMTDSIRLMKRVTKINPDEIYNLAAQSDVEVSFEVAEHTADTDAAETLRMLEAIRMAGLENSCKFFQASTSELFSMVQEISQSETTPYAAACAFRIVQNYREAHGIFASSGILFNHESERRRETFVTRKITLAAANIAAGKQDKLCLGNLDAIYDWGYAKDYVECMWMILQQDKPDDFVIATGEQHSVREFCTLSFKFAGIELEWQGEGVDEKGIDKKTRKVIVEVSPKYFRPTDFVTLLGNPAKAKATLGWNPTKTPFEELVRLMTENDIENVKENEK